MKITLDGITKRQKELLDIMWNIDSQEDLVEWSGTLDGEDANDVIVLMELIKIELIEQVLEIDKNFEDAVEIINHVKG